MKAINKITKSILVVALCFLAFSCSEDENLTSETQEFKSMDLLLETMNNTAKENNKPITFDIVFTNDVFSVNNINVVDTFEEEFALGFAKNGDPQPGDVTITCTDDPDNPTVCPGGEGQGSCVGSAVIKCLNKGECSTVCPVMATLVP